MAFSTIFFLFLFFPFALVSVHLLTRWGRSSQGRSGRFGDLLLVAVSLIFYSFGGFNALPWFLGYILLTYALGRLLNRPGSGKERSRLLGLSLAVLLLLSVLIYYKYFAYLIELTGTEQYLSFDLSALIPPLGISFITFSAISFVVDSCRSPQSDADLLDLAIYMTFFPKVISGPIVLWKDFRKQLTERSLDRDRIILGINRISTGLAKKVILADTFGALIRTIQGNLGTGIDVPTAWATAFLYFLQIYYDFAGYSSMAVGMANLFGFDFADNFNFPYAATSVTEFWRRWHISLGRWFREYLYIPLGGNRRGRARTYLHLAVVFAATGLWHGAGTGFLLWGILHGLVMILERIIRDKPFYLNIPRFIKWFFTMFFVMVGWLVFQFNSLERAIGFLKIMFGITRFDSVFASARFYFTPKILTLALIGLLGATVLSHPFFRGLLEKFWRSPLLFILGELMVSALIILSVIFIVNSTYSPFIYFQF